MPVEDPDTRDVVDAEVSNALGGHARILVYINSAMLLPIIFWAGVSWQRLNDIDGRVSRLASLDAISEKVSSVGSKVDRLEQRLDKYLDQDRRDK